jgi:hypothetical protein
MALPPDSSSMIVLAERYAEAREPSRRTHQTGRAGDAMQASFLRALALSVHNRLKPRFRHPDLGTPSAEASTSDGL